MMQPIEWLVLFYDPLKPARFAWWRIFTRKKFGHCAAIGYLPDLDMWMVVDLHLNALATYLITPKELNPVLAALKDCGFVMRWKPPAKRPVFWTLQPGLHCVTLTMRLIGFRCWALTPYQMFCALRRAGATRMFMPDKEIAA